MKRSELRTLIKEVIEEEFVRNPVNQLDLVLGRSSKEQLKDKNFLLSSIKNALKDMKFLDARAVSEIKRLFAWKNLDTKLVDIAYQQIKI